ncbi:DUF2213 domain-containing protein [Zymobacter sp. IVIA_5232.4 C2]|uniref:DUF2213 domain-containing protein n=1 Tax=Zymobacter sp. IVIA_5232.4 C2 TaxID=3394855 RepID=UPI0039C0D589
MHIRFADRATVGKVSQRVVLDNGYMQVPGKVARAGLQRYVGADFLPADLAAIEQQHGRTIGPLDPIIIYRPPEIVFDPATMAAFDNVDVIIDHTAANFVDTQTYESDSVGHAISAGRQEGDWMVVDLLIKAQRAIDAIGRGKTALSAGYDGQYRYAPGTTPDGQHYDLILTSIKPNHIALCDIARAGPAARLADSQSTGVLPMKIRLADGTSVDVADENARTLIQRELDSAAQAAQTAQQEASQAVAERDALKDENEKLLARTSDSAIAARVQEVTAVQHDAAQLTGRVADSASIDPHAIRAQALDQMGIKCRYADSWQNADPARTEARFDAELEKKQAEQEQQSTVAAKTADSLRNLGNDAANSVAHHTGSPDQARRAARDQYFNRLKGGAQ